jgi:shikimate kinase
MRSKKFFLVGMPASGKSTIGRLLASQLRLHFFDLDQIIVDKENEPITDIFAKKGRRISGNWKRIV